MKWADNGGDQIILLMSNAETSIISCEVSVAVIAFPSFIMDVTPRLFGTGTGDRNATSDLRFKPIALVERATFDRASIDVDTCDRDSTRYRPGLPGLSSNGLLDRGTDTRTAVAVILHNKSNINQFQVW